MKIIVTEEQIKKIINNVYDNILSEQIAPLNVWLNLQELLNKNKPSNAMVHLSKDGKAFFLDRYILKGQLGFSITGLVTIYDGTSWTPIGKWDPKMNTNGKLYGGWLSQNNGTKLNLSTALAQPNVLFPKMMKLLWNKKKQKNTSATITRKTDQNVSTNNFRSKCPLTFTVAKPAGGKTNNSSVDIFRYWGKDKNGNHKDPLLYTNHLTGMYAKVPNDFGWKFNNNIYPYPILYSTSCINTSNKWAKEQEALPLALRSNSRINEYVDPAYSVQKSDNTSVSKSYLGYQTNNNPIDVQSAKTNKYNQSFGKEMVKFNNALLKQKELIPQYCQTPLVRMKPITDNTNIISNWGTDSWVSMYNLCRDFGGLWVYGVGTSKYKCGCRDMSNASLTMNIESSTGDINIGNEINDTQSSRNWTHKDSIDIVTNTVAFASAFIPVVGPFISAGIMLGQAGYHWSQGDQKQAAVDALFAILPLLGQIPQVGRVTESMAKSIGNKIINSGALTPKELNTLKKILTYDKQVSTSVINKLKETAMKNAKRHILNTAVKKAEGKVIEYAGSPTTKDFKKAIASKTLNSTTKLT